MWRREGSAIQADALEEAEGAAGGVAGVVHVGRQLRGDGQGVTGRGMMGRYVREMVERLVPGGGSRGHQGAGHKWDIGTDGFQTTISDGLRTWIAT